MMKRILLMAALLTLFLAIWGCQTTTRLPAPTNPPATPSGAGCSCTVKSLGINLVSAMTWTNASSGTFGSSSTVIYPDVGSSGAQINVYSDPSISCATNLPNIALCIWKCSTNAPVYQTWQLPSGCNGFQRTAIGVCTNCTFQVSQATGFSCFIQAPKK